MLVRLVSALAAALALGAASQAQDLPEAIAQPYMAYTEAMQAHDYEAAFDAARQAWQAAERLNHDPETTGILADNYGELALHTGQSGEALRAYRRSAEILDGLNADPAIRGATWRLAALAALRDGANDDAASCADRAGDLLSPLAGPDNREVNAALFEARSIQAHAHWRQGQLNPAAHRARQALEADARPASQWTGQHALLTYYIGVKEASDREGEEAAYWLSAAYTLMSRTPEGSQLLRPLYYWSQYARGELEDRDRAALLERLASDNLIAESLELDWDEHDYDPIEEPDDHNYDAEPVERRPPDYPMRAAAAGLQGVVLVRFAIDERGRVADPEILLSVPHPIFGEAAIEAVERWRYRPKHVDGQPVRREGVVTTLDFQLMDD